MSLPKYTPTRRINDASWSYDNNALGLMRYMFDELTEPLKYKVWRRRALTMSPPDQPRSTWRWQRTRSQDCSPLFRLPLELRDRIYHYVLQEASGICHILPVSYSSGRRNEGLNPYSPCRGGLNEPHDHSGCWPSTTLYSRVVPEGKTIHLELLLTCRQIYSEGIDVLYRVNHLSFAKPAIHDEIVLKWFEPPRLAQIRHLTLQWLFYADFQGKSLVSLVPRTLGLEEACKILAAMRNLKTLRWDAYCDKRFLNDEDDNIRHLEEPLSKDVERRGLTPLTKIRQLSEHQVWAHWQIESLPVGDYRAEFTELRYTITRLPNPGWVSPVYYHDVDRSRRDPFE